MLILLDAWLALNYLYLVTQKAYLDIQAHHKTHIATWVECYLF